MAKKLKVYVAGPYLSNPARGIRAAVDAADRILELGAIPFVPHLTHLWHLISPHSYEEWLGYGLEWLDGCDLVLRLPGVSDGVDQEVEHARRALIPVIFGIEDMVEYLEAD